jgi:hypothetical protein
MSDGIIRFIIMTALMGQFVICFMVCHYVLRMIWKANTRFFHVLAVRTTSRSVPERWMQLSWLNRHDDSFQEREKLLAGCGFTWDAAWYMLFRRLAMITIPTLIFGWYVLSIAQIQLFPPLVIFIFSVTLALLLFTDRYWLQLYRRVRAERMTKEIYIVSNQLLYLEASTLHIHTKLMRCLPYTKVMRADLQLLLGEWYHDADEALRRFKQRIGTEEGLSFAETVASLRLHDSEHYYQLLRERIHDYKEKLDLAKESRKESSSYVLFALAGIPILYTFQIFIYPWVREGQQLFQSLQ